MLVAPKIDKLDEIMKTQLHWMEIVFKSFLNRLLFEHDTKSGCL